MVIARFSNETADQLLLMVEPWATLVSVPAGSKFAVHYPAPTSRADTSYAEVHDDMLRFWCEGETFEVEIDGKIILT
ncbi:MAG TPA: hypothetical protein VFR36_05365 [Sphingomicrobium sp.]|nr:hypothetical protein [Sphingomicrobium sp.]